MRTGYGADAVDQAFLELVYADEEWLRTEFEELIAASWHTPPPPPPAPPSPARQPPPAPAPPAAERVRPPEGPVPQRLRWNRQRSPPSGLPSKAASRTEGR